LLSLVGGKIVTNQAKASCTRSGHLHALSLDPAERV